MAQISALAGGDSIDVVVGMRGIRINIQNLPGYRTKGGHIANVGVHGKQVDLHLETCGLKTLR
ncbi:hypothetical protein [Sodalis-like endosymbiont of Proechinophthirus fluctus]|uniref:hypothetical protein n=1 Tax=Sodalis-like endosymbiont of Proechinophthirus fluctus TaxID=1462730 RepID=UPI0016504C2F|nr:hypothetical protein [Sodalis-like endosymbiont of Proechinophthirus fluctus]